MLKKLLAVIILLLFASSMFAVGVNEKIGIELRGGYSMINPSVLNTNLQNAFLLGFPDVFGSNPNLDVTGSKLDSLAMGNGSIQFFVTPNFALSLRTDFLYAENDDIIQINGTDIIDSHIAFNLGYIGLGGRYYIGIDGAKGFFPYIGADLGMFLHYDSFWEIWTEPNPPAGTNTYFPVTASNQYSLIDFKDSFFGGNIEAGAMYMFTDNVGVSVGLGYRIASFPVKITGTSTGVFSNQLFSSLTTVDLSGLYFSGGMNFGFGGSASGGGAAASKGTGAGAKYEAAGDQFFKTKDYTKALAYYGGAVKLDKMNSVLYKKIGLCYYYMKDMAKAKMYLGYYLKMNPDDAQIKKWLGM